MRKLLLLLAVLNSFVFAQTFDFGLTGDSDANEIIKNYINNEYNIEDVDTVAYKYDSKILGIVKHNIFYSLEGYKLIVLENNEDGYKPVKCDVFFDNTKEMSIERNKITFHKSIFYKNKKYTANIGNKEIKTNKSINDILTDRKVSNIESLTRHCTCNNVNNLELSDFKVSTQRSVNIRYNNLNEKTKHYIEMR